MEFLRPRRYVQEKRLQAMAGGSRIRPAHRGGGVEDYDPREAWPKVPKTSGRQQGLDVLQAELLIRRSLKT